MFTDGKYIRTAGCRKRRGLFNLIRKAHAVDCKVKVAADILSLCPANSSGEWVQILQGFGTTTLWVLMFLWRSGRFLCYQRHKRICRDESSDTRLNMANSATWICIEPHAGIIYQTGNQHSQKFKRAKVISCYYGRLLRRVCHEYQISANNHVGWPIQGKTLCISFEKQFQRKSVIIYTSQRLILSHLYCSLNSSGTHYFKHIAVTKMMIALNTFKEDQRHYRKMAIPLVCIDETKNLCGAAACHCG